MPDNYLTTRELASLLRIKERKVYELVGQGEVPCTKVTGKLLFPESAIQAWLQSGRLDATPVRAAAICLGSHDPLFEWALANSGCALPSYFDSSLDGLQRFAEGSGISCGLHVYHAEDKSWNRQVVEQRCVAMNAALLRFATRRRGLLVSRASSITSLAELSDRSFIARQPQSGSQILLAQLLHAMDINLDTLEVIDVARNESEAALAVADGRADAAFGLEVLAERYQLDFHPVIDECYDLVIDRSAWFDSPLQQLWSFCNSARFRAHAESLAGYDVSDLGRVIWNSPSPVA